MVNKAERSESVEFFAGKVKGIEWLFNTIDYTVKKLK